MHVCLKLGCFRVLVYTTHYRYLTGLFTNSQFAYLEYSQIVFLPNFYGYQFSFSICIDFFWDSALRVNGHYVTHCVVTGCDVYKYDSSLWNLNF